MPEGSPGRSERWRAMNDLRELRGGASCVNLGILKSFSMPYSSGEEERSLLCAMPGERDEWRGLLVTRSDSEEVLLIEQPLKPSVDGGSGVFLARASDG